MTGRTFTLTVPAPCAFINANDRGSWHKKAKLTRLWRDAAHVAALHGQLPKALGHVRIVATVHKTSPNRFDAGNWYGTAKACVDGLVDSGVLTGDDNTRVTGPDMRAGARSVKARLVLTITETDPTEGA